LGISARIFTLSYTVNGFVNAFGTQKKEKEKSLRRIEKRTD
jgi:hypothetical protein